MKKSTIYTISIIFIVLFLALVVLSFSETEFIRYRIDSRTLNINNIDVGGQKPVGWVRIPGTNIDYPVIYETIDAIVSENDYLWVPHVTTEGENRMAIFGHNIRNVSNRPIVGDDTMVRFEQLMGYVYKDFMEKHQYVQLSINGEDIWYKIYAVSFDDESEQGGYYINDEYVEEYIEKVKEDSLYKLDVDVNAKDDLISLITCTRFFGHNIDDQFRVDARRLRDDEKPTKYKVETTKNYDIIR